MPTTPALPLVRRLALPDPLLVLEALADRPCPFLLHSSLEDRLVRWSFFGADPFAWFEGAGYEEGVAAWRRLARRVRLEDSEARAPFRGGAVGGWSYDFGRRLERIPARAKDDLGLPDVGFGLYDVVGAFDHVRHEAWLFSTGLPLEGADARRRARIRLDEFAARIESVADARQSGEREIAHLEAADPLDVRCTFGPESYRAAVEKVQRHIARGDIYQANLSQRWSVPLRLAPRETIAMYRALQAVSPAPHAAYLAAPTHTVMSASPERFLELRRRQVETRPIKGTRPRGRTAADDRRLAAELRASAKDRAENVMIVDVLRNDLGRVCEIGSVRVPGLCELETFPQVFHLTSTVTGSLRAEMDAFDLLHACFPGGSITGAPKIRAMEILEEIEPVRRHVYTGSLGYVDWSGDADWNIAIRTAVAVPGALTFAAGGGITADSDPVAEHQETLDKAEGLRAAIAGHVGPLRLEPRAVPAG